MRILVTLCLLLAPVSLLAQTAIPTSVEISVLPATGDPLTIPAVANGVLVTPIAAASTLCNLVASPVPTGTLVNPTKAEFDDPFRSGAEVCRVPLPSGVAAGTGYRGVAVFIHATCTDAAGNVQTNCRGARSAVGVPPFNVALIQLPVVPTGLGVRP